MGSVNLVILDRDGNLLEYVLKHRQDTVIALVCEKNPRINSLISRFANRILYIVDYDQLLDIQNVECINYDLIMKLKFAQIDIETMLHRIMLNNPLAKDIYHQHLSFFAKIFKNEKIDLLLSNEPNLASPNHHIPFALCQLLGIPCYSLNGYHQTAFALGNYNNPQIQRHIPYICSTVFSDIRKIAYYKPKTEIIKIKKTFKNLIKNVILKIGGEMLSQFLVCCIKLSFWQNRLGIPYSYWDKLRCFIKYKQLKRKYNKYSINPNLTEKYIYYSIHFEPEAAIIGKTLLESQLTIIKMLVQALPKGWKLYVKEHPHQFMLNNEIAHYFINNLYFFKNITFYQEIQKLPKVTLVSLELSSKDLMLNSQAIATLGGTITLESALHNIPAILFNPLETVYGILNNTLHVRSYSDLLDAMEKLKNGFMQKTDANLDELKTYLADPRDKDFYHNLFATIEQHSKIIQPTGEKL